MKGRKKKEGEKEERRRKKKRHRRFLLPLLVSLALLVSAPSARSLGLREKQREDLRGLMERERVG